MQRVSSVTAFLSRYLGEPDAEAQEILNTLTDAERRAVELLITVHDANERLHRLREATGTVWSASRYERVVDSALNRLQQILHRRLLLQP